MQGCILQDRNFANAFRISFDAEATSFFTEQHVELRPGLSEHKYLWVYGNMITYNIPG